MAVAVEDVLTGLPRRDALERALQKEILAAQAESASVSVAVGDIDLFGRLNQQQGEEAADGLLRVIAEELTDTGREGRWFRFGGDAFALLLAGVEKERAFLEAEAVRARVAGEPRAGEPVTLSIGLAAYPDDGVTAVDVINKASEALYRAKVSGRNKVCLAREEKMVPKTSHYTQGQLLGLRRLAEREGLNEAVLLREGLNDLLRKYNH
jgi:diguanylate cyclase (GGDEF)-like protein